MRQDQAKQPRAPGSGRGPLDFWRRLARDRRGNVMVLMCAALLPLLGLVGSGLDVARAYTAQARLQQACDAAALAGRRVMKANAVDDKVTAEATKFFNFNYPQSTMGTNAFTPQITRPRAGTVAIRANTTIPTTIMKIFNIETLPVSASCDASQDFLNIDIVMVLDNTGSMNEQITSNGKKVTKIEALKSAIRSFYSQMDPVQKQLTENGYFVRYAFVPYSQNVNIGKLLYQQNPSYFNLAGSYFRVTKADRYAGYNEYRVTWRMDTVAHTDAWMKSGSWNGCLDERRTVASVNPVPTDAEYKSMLDLEINGVPGADASTKWMPSDVDATLKNMAQPDPMLQADACPAEVTLLGPIDDLAALNKILAKFNPIGSTYLDVGMIWGGRLISNSGVFGRSPLTYNGAPVRKYVVFLSDGDMLPIGGISSSYGVEVAQRRVSASTPNTSTLNYFHLTGFGMSEDLADRHNARFDRLCREVRGLPGQPQIWTIKLSDEAMDDHLRGCASDPAKAATVSTQEALIAQFALIAQEITELRLSL